jgi:hypothetical protein
MAGVLIVGLVGAGEVLARRNVGTASLPDFIWFRWKYFPSEVICFISKTKKAESRFDSKNCACFRLPSSSFAIPGHFIAEYCHSLRRLLGL